MAATWRRPWLPPPGLVGGGFIGWLGDEPTADVAGSELERDGVDISLAPRHADAAPIRSVITVGPDGARFIAYDDDVLHGTSDALPDDVLMQAPVLLIDGYATHAESVVARARALGLAVIADIEWTVGAATDRILAFADHLVLPLAFAQEYTGEGDPTMILEKLWSGDRSAVVLTDGERGTYLRQKGDTVRWHVLKPIRFRRSIRPAPVIAFTVPTPLPSLGVSARLIALPMPRRRPPFP